MNRTAAFCRYFVIAISVNCIAFAQQPAEGLFKELDKDKDGKVTREELPERQKANFARIDTNSDGSISLAELTAFTRAQGGGEAAKPTHADVAYGPHERNKLD